MNNFILMNFEMIVFIVQLTITVSAFYATWINLVHKQISKFGFDAFILLFFGKKKAGIVRQTPRLVARMGILTFLVGLGGVSEFVSIFTQ